MHVVQFFFKNMYHIKRKVKTILPIVTPTRNKVLLSLLLLLFVLLPSSIAAEAPVEVAANASGIAAKQGGQNSSFILFLYYNKENI